MKAFFVYMVTNRSRVVLSTGVTNDLERRVSEHKNGAVKGFTKQYKLDRLVCYENYGDVRDAITREKEIKGRREKKNALVRTLNPLWKDLGQELFNRGRRGPSPSARLGMTGSVRFPPFHLNLTTPLKRHSLAR